MPSSSETSVPYYEGLNAWRGMAILAVMCSHYFYGSIIFSAGWMGVDMFFVLSGFLITKILVANRQQKQFFVNFYGRRILRIVPVYFLFLASFYAIIFLFGKEQQLGYFVVHWKSYFLFLQNWLYITKGLPSEYYLTHLWSLAVEEQFYIIWPFVIYFCPPQKLESVLIFTIVFVCVLRCFIWASHVPYEVYYFNTATRIDSICMGSLIAIESRLLMRHTKRILLFCGLFLCFGIILFGSVEVNSPFFATVGYTILALFFASLLVIFIRVGRFKVIKKSRAMNYIGKISYCMYLVHLPVFLFVSYKLSDYVSVFQRWAPLISFALTISVSTASWYLLEERVLRLKRYFQNPAQKHQPAGV